LNSSNDIDVTAPAAAKFYSSATREWHAWVVITTPPFVKKVFKRRDYGESGSAVKITGDGTKTVDFDIETVVYSNQGSTLGPITGYGASPTASLTAPAAGVHRQTGNAQFVEQQ
ncbi:MAG: hypothetical protein AAF483_23765, partial [Planctomycetota bacterium]